jgi:hypothetical protein
MNRSAIAIVACFGLILASAPADAQLINFPHYATPSTATPSSFIAASYGRGLNEDSGKQNAFGVSVGRTGISNRVTVTAGVGMVNYDPDAKYTFGGNVGDDVLEQGATTQVSVQGGVGYISLATDFSLMNFPIGVAIKTTMEGESANIGLWAMPRVDIMRGSAFGVSSTNTDLGVSGGVSITTPGGIGFHAALDVLAADPSAMVGGAGVHFVIN